MKRTKARLTHVDDRGDVTMVDVGAKPATKRTAIAQAVVRTNAAAYRALESGALKKGDALAAARIAGIQAAKRTSELIPLCHPLQLSRVDVEIALAAPGTITVTCTAGCTGPTGVEMEALTGAAIGALTIYDMLKAMDRSATIADVRLLEKSGGKSGAFRRR